MAVIKGKDGVVQFNSNSIGKIQNFSLSITADEFDTSGIGDDWTSMDTGQQSWAAEITANFDESDTAQAAMTIGAAQTCLFQPEGTGAGLSQYSGTGVVTSVTLNEAKSGPATYSYSLRGQGTLTDTAQGA